MPNVPAHQAWPLTRQAVREQQDEP